ncbi:MAG: hypothetical protein WBF90_19045 [Rivularia sp. (in: cyanobacteria)]
MKRRIRRKIFNKLSKYATQVSNYLWNAIKISLKKLINILEVVLTYLKERKTRVLVLILFLTCIAIVFLGIYPINSNFEGVLFLNKVGFTNSEELILLGGINDIKKISGEGALSLELAGKFSSLSNPELDIKLKHIQSLTINLNNNWEIYSEKLSLKKLALQENTKIALLGYNSSENTLNISLHHNNLDKNKSDSYASLIVSDGLPIGHKFIFNNITIAGLEKLGLSGNINPMKLEVKVDNPEMSLNFSGQTQLSIFLPDIKKGINYKKWIKSNFKVKDVKLQEEVRRENGSENRSNIFEGKIRMGEREIKVEPNQFLIINENPGIEFFHNPEIIPSKLSQEKAELRIDGTTLEIYEPPKGLKVYISGKTERIQAGINTKFPISNLQSNFLKNLGFTNDLVIAIISFFSAIIISLLTWLFNDFASWLASQANKSISHP